MTCFHRTLFDGACCFTMPMDVILVRNASFPLVEETQTKGKLLLPVSWGRARNRGEIRYGG